MKKWYVAHSKPRNEELLWKQFCLRNFEAYYPCIKVQTVNPRARQVQPYFPGYLFVHVDLDLIGKSAVEWVPGGVGLVSFGDEPAVVSGGLINAIKQRIEILERAPEENVIPLFKDDNVAINAGVFIGYEGVFDAHLSGTDRVRILLSLLDNRLIPVELPASCINLIACISNNN
jgi:transcription antitermination factor NusG